MKRYQKATCAHRMTVLFAAPSRGVQRAFCLIQHIPFDPAWQSLDPAINNRLFWCLCNAVVM
jgi:hypothetical protein